MLNIRGLVGQVTGLGSGVLKELRLGHAAETVVQDLHGRYHELVYNNNVFLAANQTPATWSAGLTTTTIVGIVLENPPNSSVNLSLLQVSFVNMGTVAGNVALCATPYSITTATHTTALTVRSTLIGNTTPPRATVDQGATVPVAPYTIMPLASILTTSLTALSGVWADLSGSIMVMPGCMVAICASAAVVGMASFIWEEDPV